MVNVDRFQGWFTCALGLSEFGLLMGKNSILCEEERGSHELLLSVLCFSMEFIGFVCLFGFSWARDSGNDTWRRREGGADVWRFV